MTGKPWLPKAVATPVNFKKNDRLGKASYWAIVPKQSPYANLHPMETSPGRLHFGMWPDQIEAGSWC